MVPSTPRKTKVPNILGDWDDVRFFLAVAKTGSFSSAATQLNTKQTTVGRRNRAFEAPELIDAFTDLERRLASPEGETRSAPPARPAPRRARTSS